MTPHKHAALIKVWADGALIQYRDRYSKDGKWNDCVGSPSWDVRADYRIKPRILRYRAFLWQPANGSDRRVVSVCSDKEDKDEPRETWAGFIRWLGDWQEVEV